MVAVKTDSLTVSAIYAAYEAKSEDTRSHLGASQIGTECERALWYSFRWCTKQWFSGRQRRLFETGHREEDRLIANLRLTGATVLERDPETGRQWQIREFGGHFGGSLDGMALGILEAPTKWHVVECKTHNVKSFNALKRHGVLDTKPIHYVQMQVYMYKMQLDRALYFSMCKDTDELYTERLHIDKVAAEWAIKRAGFIIFEPVPPPKINDNADFYLCRFCDHRAKCHDGELSERNCRTCVHSTPMADGTWLCEHHTTTLSYEQQRAGCDSHLYIPDLVDGTPIEASKQAIVYKMRDGSTWVNEVAAA